MEKIKLNDFLSYKYLSGLKVENEDTLFILKKAKEDLSGYDSDIYRLRGKKVTPLTTSGDVDFFDIKNKNILFPSRRNEDERKNKLSTFLYSLDTTGGEAKKILEVKEKVISLKILKENEYIFLTYVDKRTEGLRGDEKEKKSEEIKSYEDIEESEFYLNGKGYINGRRIRFTLYRDGDLKCPFKDDFSVDGYSLNKDESKALVWGEECVPPQRSRYSELREVDLTTLKWKTILDKNILSLYGAWYLGDKIISLGNDMKTYGINQNPDFYTFSEEKPVLFKSWGESIGSSVGTDVKLGGGESVLTDFKNNRLLFISTSEYSSNIYSLSEDGNIERLTNLEGEISEIALDDDKNVNYISLQGKKLQEVYSINSSSPLTNFSEVLKGKYIATPEEITFKSNGDEIKGWVLKPFGYKECKSYPAIFDIHGGPKTVYGKIFVNEMQYWASEGYFVFFTNPHGGDGRGDDFADIRGKYGTIDYEDLMNFVDIVLERYPEIDKTRVGVTGGSYGGFMSNWILGHTNRFSCIITQRSISSWTSFIGTSDIGPYFATDQCGAKYDEREKLEVLSPLPYILKNATTPTLIIHSDKDYRCPVEQGYQLYNALVYKKVEAKMVLFHDETHELSRSGKPKNRIKRLSEITKWMDKYLKKKN